MRIIDIKIVLDLASTYVAVTERLQLHYIPSPWNFITPDPQPLRNRREWGRSRNIGLAGRNIDRKTALGLASTYADVTERLPLHHIPSPWNFITPDPQPLRSRREWGKGAEG